MKTLAQFIIESKNDEDLEKIKSQIKDMDRQLIFNGEYELDNCPEEFFNILKSLAEYKNPSDKSLKGTWGMLFSKLVIEPLVQ